MTMKAINIEDLRQLARKRLPRVVFEFIDGGAQDDLADGRIDALAGELVQPLTIKGKSRKHGTLVRFWPDADVFETVDFKATILEERLQSRFRLGLCVDVQPPDVSWGLLMMEGLKVITPIGIHWWLVLFPGLALAATLFAMAPSLLLYHVAQVPFWLLRRGARMKLTRISGDEQPRAESLRLIDLFGILSFLAILMALARIATLDIEVRPYAFELALVCSTLWLLSLTLLLFAMAKRRPYLGAAMVIALCALFAWLGSAAGTDILAPYPADLMRAYPVDRRVGNVKNNHPSIIEPLQELI